MKPYKRILASLLLALFSLTAVQAEIVYYDTDNVGTPVAMWDENGKKVWEGEYFPFGEEYRISELPQKNDKRFIGKEKDKETGLTYFGARYMDEKTGRFITPDPVRPVDPFTSKTNRELLENPQRLNRYAYGLNNPYRYVDPDGEVAIAVVALAAVGAWAVDAMMPKSTDVPNSKGFLDYADNATMMAPGGMIRNVTKVPKLIKASKIYLSHPAKLSTKFSNPALGTVGDLARKLKSGQIKASDIPPVEVAKINGKLYSANNRRLKAFQEAGAKIRTIPASKLKFPENLVANL